MKAKLTATDLACARFGAPVFEGVTFQLISGAILVVRGPNGSGKSSLLRVLASLLPPSEGTIACDLGAGVIPAEAVARSVHLVGHRSALTEALSASENLRFQTAVLGGDRALVGSALERVGLAASERTPARLLSAGQRRRLALARLITTPRPIWLLDEPTEFLDAAGETMVGELIEFHCRAGGIVVVASHGGLAAATASELTLIPDLARAA